MKLADYFTYKQDQRHNVPNFVGRSNTVKSRYIEAKLENIRVSI